MSIDDRLEKLVQATSVDEQIGQLTNKAPAILHAGIPAYNWLSDDEHGVKQAHATSFPNGCGLGATWSKETLRAVGIAVGEEARGTYNTHVHQGDRGNENGVGITMYAPNMNLVRDPRWGRAQEVYSEDPYLSSRLTYEFVNGSQVGNTSSEPKYWQAAACCKHYAAYDLETDPVTRHVFDAKVDARNMWETYMPAFRACVSEAQGGHVMCSYNSMNGVPTCGNEELLNGVLRRQWNWPGFVVSDYDAWAQIYETHNYCPNMTCAAAVGLKAGMDQEGGSNRAISQLHAALDQHNVTADQIAIAFKRLFRVRLLLGMHDPLTMVPWNYITGNESFVEGPSHIALARAAAGQAISMYKNNNNTLPLSKDIKRLAVIGPSATQGSLLLGNYAITPDKGVQTILDAIMEALGDAPPANYTGNCTQEDNIDYYVQGQGGATPSPDPKDCCTQCSLDPTCQYYTWHKDSCYKKKSDAGRKTSQGRISGKCLDHPMSGKVQYSSGCSSIECPDTKGFDDAVQASEGAEAIVIVLGLDKHQESEGHDRTVLELPGNQTELVSTLRKAHQSTAIILVLVHGGTLALGDAAEHADAILDAWYPGMEGAHGLVDVLFGKRSPAGRASVTYYTSTSELPPAGTMDLYPSSTSHGLTYRHYKGKPLFPFGFGLSYTKFKYSDLKVETTAPKACDDMKVSVTVMNTGSRDGDEVVQLYVKQPHASVPVPQVRLVDFERVTIPQGQSKTVELTIRPEFHSIITETGGDVYIDKQSVEKGEIEIYVGGGQPDF